MSGKVIGSSISISSVYDGKDGPQGPSGNNAVNYELVPASSQLKTNAARTVRPTTSVTAYKIDGNSRTAFSGGTISYTPYKADGTQADTTHTETGTSSISGLGVVVTQGNTPVSRWEIILTVSSVVMARVDIPVVSSGPTLRGPRVYKQADGFSYQSGAEGEAFLDLVIHNGSFYQCIKSYKEDSSHINPPGLANLYWLLATQFDFVATNLLLAQRAKIVNLVVEELEARQQRAASGNIQSGWYSYMAGGEFEIGTYVQDDTSDIKTPRYKLGMVTKNNKEYPVIQFCDTNGIPIGQIDESIFTNASSQLDSWSSIELIYYPETSNPSGMNNTRFNQYAGASGLMYYQYSEGFTVVNGLRTYSIGLWDGSSFDQSQHSKLHGKYLRTMIITDSHKKGTYTVPANGYYIDPIKTKQSKKNSAGITTMTRWCLDVYLSSSDGNYKGQMTKVGILTSEWEDSGLAPAE